jgi:hypothetical protein
MRNLDIEFPELDDTLVPTGDECEHSARGENCGRTDCEECGTRAAAVIRDNARLGERYVMQLAREVVRVVEKHGANIPDGAVAMGDLARVHAAMNGNRWDVLDGTSWAWAEGVCEALTGTGDIVVLYRTATEDDAHEAGVQFVKAWRAEQCRLHEEAQAMADADTTSAAGGLISPPHGTAKVAFATAAAPGFESRAQHRGLVTPHKGDVDASRPQARTSRT